MKVSYNNPTKEGIARREARKEAALRNVPVTEEMVLERYKKLDGLFKVLEEEPGEAELPVAEPTRVETTGRKRKKKAEG